MNLRKICLSKKSQISDRVMWNLAACKSLDCLEMKTVMNLAFFLGGKIRGEVGTWGKFTLQHKNNYISLSVILCASIRWICLLAFIVYIKPVVAAATELSGGKDHQKMQQGISQSKHYWLFQLWLFVNCGWLYCGAIIGIYCVFYIDLVNDLASSFYNNLPLPNA